MFGLGGRFIPLAIAAFLLIGAVAVFIVRDNDLSETYDQVETVTLKSAESAPSLSSKSNGEKDIPPVLKNLGVNIDTWNRQTNLAGDLIFDNGVIYDDGRVAGDKVFLDFGMKDKYRTNDLGAIEYWFYVPIGTKVHSPIDGTVQVVFFEHTQDWGVNMVSKGRWIVSF